MNSNPSRTIFWEFWKRHPKSYFSGSILINDDSLTPDQDVQIGLETKRKEKYARLSMLADTGSRDCHQERSHEVCRHRI